MVAAVWVIWSNVTVELHRITVQSAGLPTAFDGARIAHVSDLHNASFGEDNQTLLQLLRQSQPDIICLLYTSPSPRDTERRRYPSSA